MKIVAKLFAKLRSLFRADLPALTCAASVKSRANAAAGFRVDASPEVYEAELRRMQDSDGLRLRLDHSSQDGHFRV